MAGRAGDSYAGNTATASVLAGAGLEGCVATGRPHAFNARATPLPGGLEQGGGRLVLATGTPPPAFVRADPPELDEIAKARPGMERQDLPAWVDDVLRRKEALAEQLAAHLSDAPDEERARRLRLRGRDAELTRTLDERRTLREARGAPMTEERE